MTIEGEDLVNAQRAELDPYYAERIPKIVSVDELGQLAVKGVYQGDLRNIQQDGMTLIHNLGGFPSVLVSADDFDKLLRPLGKLEREIVRLRLPQPDGTILSIEEVARIVESDKATVRKFEVRAFRIIRTNTGVNKNWNAD